MKIEEIDFNSLYDKAYHNRGRVPKEQLAPHFFKGVKQFLLKDMDSVVDLGCGMGIFLKEFQKRNIEIKGYEPSQYALDNNKVDSVEFGDLRTKIDFEKKYDLAMCIEVIEHIEEKYEMNVIQNLVRASDNILFSAAISHQPGQHHVNCKTKPYWKNIFEYLGYKSEHIKTSRFRNFLKKHNCPRWLGRNPMFFTKRDSYV